MLFDAAPVGVAEPTAVLLQVFFGPVHQWRGLVGALRSARAAAVLGGMLLGFADHALNIRLGRPPEA